MTTSSYQTKDVTLLELLDRILDRGVVIGGDLTISVADVDLIYVGLKVMLTSVERANAMRYEVPRPAKEIANV